MEQFLKISGTIAWILLTLFIFIRLIFGKRWMIKAGATAFLGTGLVISIQKLFRELPNKVQRDTLAEVGAKIINRILRIGLVGLALALVPIWLLINQNTILRKQTEKIDIQNNLMESQRRNSLVLLMSNIMDQMNDEIQEQKNDPNHIDSLGYSLSEPLIGRIAALSQGFLPYRLYRGDTLSTKEYSPERGQLLLALVNSQLDSVTYEKVYKRITFQSAYLNNVSLRSANLRFADLRFANLRSADLSSANLSFANLGFADLSFSDLYEANLSEASLFTANLSSSRLINADLSSANLSSVNFHSANLRYANFYNHILNIGKEDLLVASSLYKCRYLNPIIQQEIQIEKPCLFTLESCE